LGVLEGSFTMRSSLEALLERRPLCDDEPTLAFAVQGESGERAVGAELGCMGTDGPEFVIDARGVSEGT
jgi:hypothetical protein